MRSNPLHLHRASRLLGPAALTLALAACMVGPDHVRPTLSVPEQFVRDDHLGQAEENHDAQHQGQRTSHGSLPKTASNASKQLPLMLL